VRAFHAYYEPLTESEAEGFGILETFPEQELLTKEDEERTHLGGTYGVCVKAAKVDKKYTGLWNDVGCELGPNAKKEGKYEWWPGRSGSEQARIGEDDFKFKSPIASAVLSSAAGTITCKRSIAEGEVLGEQYNVEKIVARVCKLSTNGAECRAWTNSKHIANLPEVLVFADTYLINHGTLGSSGLEPKEREVWNAFFPAEGYGLL